MKSKLTMADVTPDIKHAVNAYLLARAFAEITREQVNKIETEILQNAVLLKNDLEVRHGEPEKQITDPKYAYLSEDEKELKYYYAECDRMERAAGIKPETMPFEHCPALVAEHTQLETEWLIIEEGAKMMEMDFEPKELNNKLLCLPSGLEKRQKFIDLIVCLVVSLPDFKNPLTGKGV